MENADTRHLKFAPDVGQLQKGGSDPVKTIKDFLAITRHMHLKDFVGGEHYVGYCPLGMGKVNIPAILDMMGVHETTAQSVDEFVAIAAALGRNVARRGEASARIAANKHCLYRDRDCIAGLESFLELAVGKA